MKQALWSEKIGKNLSDFKYLIGLRFKNDLMLLLHIKNKVLFIFNKLSLFHVFCHFAFCRRNCDSDTFFC